MTGEPWSGSSVAVSGATLERLVDISQRAGLAILACRGGAHETKADGSPVTQADRAAEELICTELLALDADTPIVSEERPLPEPNVRQGWRRYWLVDPLDGTKEFLAGLPEFTVNIALIEDGAPVLGVVCAPALETVYYAGRGLRSWRRTRDEPATRLCATPPPPGAGLRVVESRSHPSPELEAFLRELHVIERIRMGSSLKFCCLAEGRADCYPRLGPTMAWDVAAGDCVFRHASANGQPHWSPLTYDPVDLRSSGFIVGFAPHTHPDRPLARLP